MVVDLGEFEQVGRNSLLVQVPQLSPTAADGRAAVPPVDNPVMPHSRCAARVLHNRGNLRIIMLKGCRAGVTTVAAVGARRRVVAMRRCGW
jgi:hypothetical protein